jgi:plastocyanin
MRKFIIILAIVLFIIAIVLIIKKSKPEDLKIPESNNINQTQSLDQISTLPQVVDVIVDGSNFSFTPNVIKVKQGDTVNITFRNNEGFHDFRIDEFNVAASQIKANEQEKITFIADKKGSFEYYCSIGTHRQQGMWGTLIVE